MMSGRSRKVQDSTHHRRGAGDISNRARNVLDNEASSEDEPLIRKSGSKKRISRTASRIDDEEFLALQPLSKRKKPLTSITLDDSESSGAEPLSQVARLPTTAHLDESESSGAEPLSRLKMPRSASIRDEVARSTQEIQSELPTREAETLSEDDETSSSDNAVIEKQSKLPPVQGKNLPEDVEPSGRRSLSESKPVSSSVVEPESILLPRAKAVQSNHQPEEMSTRAWRSDPTPWGGATPPRSVTPASPCSLPWINLDKSKFSATEPLPRPNRIGFVIMKDKFEDSNRDTQFESPIPDSVKVLKDHETAGSKNFTSRQASQFSTGQATNPSGNIELSAPKISTEPSSKPAEEAETTLPMQVEVAYPSHSHGETLSYTWKRDPIPWGGATPPRAANPASPGSLPWNNLDNSKSFPPEPLSRPNITDSASTNEDVDDSTRETQFESPTSDFVKASKDYESSGSKKITSRQASQLSTGQATNSAENIGSSALNFTTDPFPKSAEEAESTLPVQVEVAHPHDPHREILAWTWKRDPIPWGGATPPRGVTPTIQGILAWNKDPTPWGGASPPREVPPALAFHGGFDSKEMQRPSSTTLLSDNERTPARSVPSSREVTPALVSDVNSTTWHIASTRKSKVQSLQVMNHAEDVEHSDPEPPNTKSKAKLRAIQAIRGSEKINSSTSEPRIGMQKPKIQSKIALSIAKNIKPTAVKTAISTRKITERTMQSPSDPGKIKSSGLEPLGGTRLPRQQARRAVPGPRIFDSLALVPHHNTRNSKLRVTRATGKPGQVGTSIPVPSPKRKSALRAIQAINTLRYAESSSSENISDGELSEVESALSDVGSSNSDDDQATGPEPLSKVVTLRVTTHLNFGGASNPDHATSNGKSKTTMSRSPSPQEDTDPSGSESLSRLQISPKPLSKVVILRVNTQVDSSGPSNTDLTTQNRSSISTTSGPAITQDDAEPSGSEPLSKLQIQDHNSPLDDIESSDSEPLSELPTSQVDSLTSDDESSGSEFLADKSNSHMNVPQAASLLTDIEPQAPKPLVSKVKPKPRLPPQILDISLYMPLGSFNFIPSEDTVVSQCFEECSLPPACLSAEHPLYMPLSQLLADSSIRIFVGRNQRHIKLAMIRVWIVPDDVGLGNMPHSWKRNRPALRKLMSNLNFKESAWVGEGGLITSEYVYGSESEEDEEQQQEDSLYYIFNTLDSPSPDTSCIEDCYARDAMIGLLEGSPVVYGLKTTLYPYQCRSAAMMIQREAQPARMLDPRLKEFLGPTGRKFFFDPQACTIYSTRREYDEACGGILAETMGYGKTLICLATILQTKGHWPRVPPIYSENLNPIRPQVGSLIQMAAAAASRTRIPWKPYFEQLSREGAEFTDCVRCLKENIGSYTISRAYKKHSVRPVGGGYDSEKITVSSTTLIIVPSNLIVQWCREFKRHLEADCLSMLVVDDNYKTLPDASKLQEYDIILISKPRFERENEIHGNSVHSLKRGGMVRVRSPLMNLHFLRLIVDEGHSFGSSAHFSNAGMLVRKLHVERKWIISGTPSSGLMGVEVDTAALETQDNTTLSGRNANREALAARRKEIAIAQERKDIEKIGRIVVDFLALQPWSNGKGANDACSWRKYVMPALSGARKPTSLKRTLESLVVRHRIEDIEADLQLPPLHNHVVHIHPGYYDKLSINLFILTLTANAVTSERVDQDYMFHPSNRKELDELVRNLRQSGFYWTGFGYREVSETVRVSREYLNNPEKVISDEDRKSLELAIYMGEKCLNSPAWKAFSELAELGLFVEEFPEEASWGWVLDSSTSLQPLLVGATQLRLAQTHIQKNLYVSDPAAGLLAAGLTAMSKARRDANLRSIKSSPSKDTSLAKYQARSKVGRVVPESTILELPCFQTRSITAHAAEFLDTKNDSPTRTVPQPVNGLKPAMKSSMKSAMKSSSASNAHELFALPESSPLARTKLVGTASAKLSYLLDRVIELHQEEKIIIFYEGDHIAWYIAQCLEIINVQHLIYAKGTSVALRNAYVETFNGTETFRVLLMDLRLGAQGLHVASASRVFFINPVWQPNIEAQAIKRAHRIGQTRTVFVETLVLKNTIEEQLLARRKAMTNQEHFKASKSPLDDSTMNELIKNATFIPFHDGELENLTKQVASLEHPQLVFQRLVKNSEGFAGELSPWDTSINPYMPLNSEPLPRWPKRKAILEDLSDLADSTDSSHKRRSVGRITFNVPEEPPELPEPMPGVETTVAPHSSLEGITFDVPEEPPELPEPMPGVETTVAPHSSSGGIAFDDVEAPSEPMSGVEATVTPYFSPYGPTT